VSEPLELHLHIPPGLTGVIHLHLGSSAPAGGGLVAAAPAVTTAAAPAAPTASAAPGAEASDFSEMLARFERHDPGCAARTVYESLVDRGWVPHLPKPRGGKPASAAAYVRLTYNGQQREVSLYLNSAGLMSSGRGQRQFVEGLPGTEPRPDDVYLPHGGGATEQAIANAVALQGWADGEHEPVTS
jgi:hypothetical protein